jgi:hypothetical protein
VKGVVKAALVLLVIGVSTSHAQDVPHVTGTNVEYRRMLELIGTAQHRVLAYLPVLTDQLLADALRSARVDANQRAQVLVVTVPYFAAKEQAYSNSLALAGVGVVEAQVNSKEAYLLIDDDLFGGSLLGRSTGPVKVFPRSSSNGYLQWYQKVVQAGQVVTPYIAYQRIGGTLK